MYVSKTITLINHSVRRAKERYGLDLSASDIDDIVVEIQAQKAKFIARQSNRLTVFQVVIGSTVCNVVYDSNRKTIVTFLPPGAPVYDRDRWKPGGRKAKKR